MEVQARLEVVSLSPALGAEIRGVDASRSIDDATFAAILKAWHQHLVIVLRGQALDEDEQVRFAERFGELSPMGTTPERYMEIMKEDMVKYAKLAKDAGIKPE